MENVPKAQFRPPEKNVNEANCGEPTQMQSSANSEPLTTTGIQSSDQLGHAVHWQQIGSKTGIFGVSFGNTSLYFPVFIHE